MGGGLGDDSRDPMEDEKGDQAVGNASCIHANTLNVQVQKTVGS